MHDLKQSKRYLLIILITLVLCILVHDDSPYGSKHVEFTGDIIKKFVFYGFTCQYLCHRTTR